MTVPEQTPYKEYDGNGVTKTFTLEFICESKDHLNVTIDGVEPEISAWSFNANTNSVTFSVAPATDSKIVLQRNTPMSRTTNYQSTNNSMTPKALNADIDRVWLKLQELGVADMLLKIYVDRLHGEQKKYIDQKDTQLQNNINTLSAYVDQQDAQLQQNIDNLKIYVDDKDDELRAYLLEEIRKQGVALDQLDEYYNYLMQRLAQIAVDKGWDASFVVDESGKTQQELNSNLSFRFKAHLLTDAIYREVYYKLSERISIKDFGAIGDGAHHPLQEWVDSGKFSGLMAIQIAFPFVKTLNQSIDWCATQHALYTSKSIHAPAGKYVFSDVAKFPHNTSPYNMGVSAVAPRLFGDGVCTSFTRNDERAATRILNVEGTSTTQASDTENMNEACFSVHCPYSQISDLTIESSRIGIYLGQDFAKPFTSLSSVSSSSFKRLQIKRCGTGVLMLAVGGNHYCEFNDIHFADCQIDVHQRSSFWWKITQGRGDANNNRNVFNHIRSGRSRIGYWNQCGDTNTLLTWHGEGINHTTASNPYTVPDGLPAGIPNNSCLFVFDKFNQLNTVAFCNVESTNWHLYNDGANNSFTHNTINEGFVTLVSKPLKWDGRYVLRNRGIGYVDNAYPEAFPEMPVPGALYLGLQTPNGVRCVSRDTYHQPTSNLRGSYKREFSIEVDTIPANTPTPVTIWASQANVDMSTSAMIDVDVVGRCDTAGQISSFNTKATVNAYRTSARAISRFGISTLSASRATYENSLDLVDTNQIALTAQKNATTPQSLELVITCPFDLTGASVFVSQKIMK